ncbi:MAG: cupin domain-containing protein [Alphaproteobacteria bacterium]
MKRNFLTTPLEPRVGIHDGEGSVGLAEIWSRDDFRGNWDFVDRLLLPPGSTVGTHRHGDNEELYIVLKGRGVMTMNGESFSVAEGDMMLNPPGGEHGLVNDSGEDIDLLIIQVRVP